MHLNIELTLSCNKSVLLFSFELFHETLITMQFQYWFLKLKTRWENFIATFKLIPKKKLNPLKNGISVGLSHSKQMKWRTVQHAETLSMRETHLIFPLNNKKRRQDIVASSKDSKQHFLLLEIRKKICRLKIVESEMKIQNSRQFFSSESAFSAVQRSECSGKSWLLTCDDNRNFSPVCFWWCSRFSELVC